MRKPVIISSAFGLAIIIALIFVVSNKKTGTPDKFAQPSSSTSNNPNAVNADEKQQTAPSVERTATPGQYIDYSQATFASAKGQKVLFFHAPWCPQCRSIEKTILEDKNSIPSGITVLKVDYDSNQALRQKYGITIQTTFVKVDDSGNLIDKYVAYDEPTIDSVKKNFLLLR